MKNIYYFPLFLFFLFSLQEGCCQIPNLPDSPYPKDYANYITMQNKRFMNGNAPFKPFCINYLVDYVQFKQSGTRFVSPLLNYSENGGMGSPIILNGNEYSYYYTFYGSTESEIIARAKDKLDKDLRFIDSLGFNVIRLRPAIYWEGDSLRIPAGSYSEYFRLTDSLIYKCFQNHFRVILVLSDATNTYNQFEQYCTYLDSVTKHYSGNRTVMAYVTYMEPTYKWSNNSLNDKLMISNWSRKWYNIAKKNAPNQLVTIALDGIESVLAWDPSALTYDFLTMHLYYNTNRVGISKAAIHSYFKWLNENIDDVWVLGETGFSAIWGNPDCEDYQPGTPSDQYVYADYTMQQSLNCGCAGYAWWQYQDVKWGYCLHDYVGIITLFPEESLKVVHSVFPTYQSKTASKRCSRPNNYYNIPCYEFENISGLVLDEDNNPIQDAVVVAWSDTYKSSYLTFTNADGEYHIKTPVDTVISEIRVSQTGYSETQLFPVNGTVGVATLTHINYDNWKKNWTNINYPNQHNIPYITSDDTIVVGNFFGDEAQELLIIKTLIQTAILYRFNIDHWEQFWAGTIGGWVIRDFDRFAVGDIDGDGYDELLCYQNLPNAWVSFFRYNPQYSNDPWQYVWTNMGSGYIGNWYYVQGDVILPGNFNDSTYTSLLCVRNQNLSSAFCQRFNTNTWTWENVWNNSSYLGSWYLSDVDKYYVGDFNGDAIDELLCVQKTNGNHDWMQVMKFSPDISNWITLWTNNGQSEGDGLYSYRGLLHVGNFDQDDSDEILGIDTWATKFDFNSSNYWDWSWSTYESGKLSDLQVSPNLNVFFIKALSKVPDYLFVHRWKSSGFKFDAYTYDL